MDPGWRLRRGQRPWPAPALGRGVHDVLRAYETSTSERFNGEIGREPPETLWIARERGPRSTTAQVGDPGRERIKDAGLLLKPLGLAADLGFGVRDQNGGGIRQQDVDEVAVVGPSQDGLRAGSGRDQ